MPKFKTGFLLGAMLGTTYALFTTKKSGPTRIHQIAQYFSTLTDATGDVQHAVTRFSSAVEAVKHEVDTTLKPNLKDISDRVDQYEFQTEARMKNVNDHLENIEDATGSLSGDDHDAKDL